MRPRRDYDEADPVDRHELDVIGERRKHSIDEAVSKAATSRDLLLWPEGTVCPEFDNALLFWNGWHTLVRRAHDQGVPLHAVPTVGVYTLNEDFSAKDCFIEFSDPFGIEGYQTPQEASHALRDFIVDQKRMMNAMHNPGMTSADWKRAREVLVRQRPTNPDYSNGAVFSLDYRLAKKSSDTQMVQEVVDRFN